MTIAQKFISKNVLYQDYDFQGRKLRRNECINKKIASQNLVLMKKIFESFDIEFVLLFGTVVGAVRDKDFIDYDHDTDTGIYEEDRPKLIRAIPTLLENGFDIIRTKYPDDLVTFMKEDEYIDVGIFRFIRKNLKDYYTYQGHLISSKFLGKLEKISFLGEEFNIPSNKELYLSKTYGSDWGLPRRNEPALNTGILNMYHRLRRSFVRTKLGQNIKRLLGRSL